MAIEIKGRQEEVVALVNGKMRTIKRVIVGLVHKPVYMLPSIKEVVKR